ncbi:MAG: hypothetical protein ACON4Z_14390 [Planctomycetota bacterium]
MPARTAAAFAVTFLLSTALLAPLRGQQAASSAATFRNYNRTFQLELPDDWRQLAPGEAVRIGEQPAAPPILRLCSPRQYYGVGPVDRWLAGDFESPWLYVFEQRDGWHVEDDFAATLRDLWREHGEANGVRHQLQDIHKERLGTQGVECIVATRTTTPAPPAAQRVSLDVHAPTAQQQITLSFTATPDTFEQHVPEFRRWLTTLTFARVADDQQQQDTVLDRIGRPILIGGIVGLILALLYRYTRARR